MGGTDRTTDLTDDGKSSFQYTYDDADRLLTIRFHDDEIVANYFDSSGQLRMVQTMGGFQYVRAVTYDLFGRPVHLKHYNHVIDKREYWPLAAGGHLESIRSHYGSYPHLHLKYDDYTAHGQLETVVDLRDGNLDYPSEASASAT